MNYTLHNKQKMMGSTMWEEVRRTSTHVHLISCKAWAGGHPGGTHTTMLISDWETPISSHPPKPATALMAVVLTPSTRITSRFR